MTASTKKELETEVKRLNKELSDYKLAKKSTKNRRFKNTIKWLCFALACAILVVANLSFYGARTLIETDKFSQVASDLIEQPAVQSAIATKTTQAIFENVDLEQFFIEVLPPRADVAAPLLSDQIQKFTLDKSKEILANPTFQEKTVNIIDTAHSTFIEGVRNYQGDGTINVDDIYQNLSGELQNTKLSALANKQLPPKIGSVQVFEASWLPTLHNIVVNLNLVRALTATLFVGLMAIFIWLSGNRRRAIIQIGLSITLLGLVTILSLNVAKSFVVDSAVNFPEAVEQIWTVLAGPLISQTIGAMILGLGLALVAWLGGNTKNAQWMKLKINTLLSGRLHQVIFSKENTLTLWCGTHKRILQLIVSLGFIVCLALISITLSSIITVLLVFALLGLMVEVLSAPSSKLKK